MRTFNLCVLWIFVGGARESVASPHVALISRSVTGHRSFVTLKCPKGHVFSNVKFSLKGRHNECLKKSQRAQRRCRWRRRCRVDTKVKTPNCSVSAIQMSNLKCVPEDSFVNICRSADTGAVWITNFGRIKTAQVKGKCRRIRKNVIGFRNRRRTRATGSHVKGVVTQENGIIQDRIGWQRKTYKFSCPKNSVIYSVDFHLSYIPHTRRSKPVCQGLSPRFLVHKNSCFWKESCRVSWNSPQVIANSPDFQCIGKLASLFTTKEHQCMPKDRINDICKKGETKGRRGLLRSHNNYPWNYRTFPQNCTTLIKIKPDGALYLRLHDVDIDSSHDGLITVHVRDSVTCVVPESSLREGVWLHGGYVKVHFTVAHRSKAGRGFIMSYKNVKERLPNSLDEKRDRCSQYIKK